MDALEQQVSRAAGGVPPPPERIAKSAELHKDSQVCASRFQPLYRVVA